MCLGQNHRAQLSSQCIDQLDKSLAAMEEEDEDVRVFAEGIQALSQVSFLPFLRLQSFTRPYSCVQMLSQLFSIDQPLAPLIPSLPQDSLEINVPSSDAASTDQQDSTDQQQDPSDSSDSTPDDETLVSTDGDSSDSNPSTHNSQSDQQKNSDHNPPPKQRHGVLMQSLLFIALFIFMIVGCSVLGRTVHRIRERRAFEAWRRTYEPMLK